MIRFPIFLLISFLSAACQGSAVDARPEVTLPTAITPTPTLTASPTDVHASPPPTIGIYDFGVEVEDLLSGGKRLTFTWDSYGGTQVTLQFEARESIPGVSYLTLPDGTIPQLIHPNWQVFTPE